MTDTTDDLLRQILDRLNKILAKLDDVDAGVMLTEGVVEGIHDEVKELRKST